MERKPFFLSVWLAIVTLSLGLTGQKKPAADADQASVPEKPMIDLQPTKLKNAAWTVSTDPNKPNVIKVIFDFRQLSVVQVVYSVQCTVRVTDPRTHKTQRETFSTDVLGGGQVYVKEFKSHLKVSDWKSVQVEGEKLEGNVASHIFANRPAVDTTPTVPKSQS